MPDDLIPPQDPPTPAAIVVPAPGARLPGPVSCEFCKCDLAPDGSVMKMSDEARAYRDQREQLDRVKTERDSAQSDLRAAHGEIAALKTAANPPGEPRPVFDLRRRPTT